MFHSILAPYDGSQGAEAALRKAVDLSLLCQAELTLLTHFWQHTRLDASIPSGRSDAPENTDTIMRQHAKEVAARGKTLAIKAGFPEPKAFVKGGPVARTITAFSQEHGADLIVIGSRGLGSLEGVLLGSISHKVTSLSETPVLLV